MKPLALIIDDDPAIQEVLADRLESLGHDSQGVCCHHDARERLARCSYDYILLDLELPVKFGRPASIQIGKNILREIRESERHKNTPVLVVTAHGHDRPDLAVELMKAGACDFIKKPFENLEQAIAEALGRNGNRPSHVDASSTSSQENRGLENASITFHPNGITLEGLTLCTPESGVIWRILLMLRERKTNGQPRAFPGKRIADTLNLERGQNAICEAVSAFRKKSVQILEDAGFLADEDTVVITGRSGYQLHSSLTVVDNLDGSTAAPTPASDLQAEDRQAWFLAEINKGRKLRRIDLEKKFKISMPTAKRDLGELGQKIEFYGCGAAGYYRAKSPSNPP